MMPRMPGTPVTVAAADLRVALARVLPAVSRDRKESLLQCVLVEARRDLVRLVATDRHRLVVAEMGAHGAGDADAVIRAPVRASALEGIDLEPDGRLGIALDDDRLVIGDQRVDVVAGDFPDYERFLAADARTRSLTVERAALLHAIEGGDDEAPLRFRFTAGRLEVDEPPVPMAASYDGPSVEVLLDAGYAHDAVAAAAGPDVVRSPVVVRSPGNTSYTAIVMPVRRAEPRPDRRR
jgi:DNA polymerase III sliding clamp (beta) subunit (PCNA family)